MDLNFVGRSSIGKFVRKVSGETFTSLVLQAVKHFTVSDLPANDHDNASESDTDYFVYFFNSPIDLPGLS
jgi:hypothetical protein